MQEYLVGQDSPRKRPKREAYVLLIPGGVVKKRNKLKAKIEWGPGEREGLISFLLNLVQAR